MLMFFNILDQMNERVKKEGDTLESNARIQIKYVNYLINRKIQTLCRNKREPEPVPKE